MPQASQISRTLTLANGRSASSDLSAAASARLVMLESAIGGTSPLLFFSRSCGKTNHTIKRRGCSSAQPHRVLCFMGQFAAFVQIWDIAAAASRLRSHHADPLGVAAVAQESRNLRQR